MTGATIHQWLSEPPPTDVQAALRRIRRAPGVRHVAVMPDVHLAGEVCIGTVVATQGVVYPKAVGGDIGCGITTMRFDCDAARVDSRTAKHLLAALRQLAPILSHAVPKRGELPDGALSTPKLRRTAQRVGLAQLGTLGRGNHFIELQRDEEHRLWAMVHSGSRGIGQAITAHHLARASPTGLGGLRDEAAEAYLSDAAWALSYARSNRRWLLAAVSAAVDRVLGGIPVESSLIDCEHNHVRSETHHGCTCWVHRKGATPASAGQPGVIPGSMGTCSFHVEGRGHPDALRSSSHGAGRRLSRTLARRHIAPATLRREMRGVYYDETSTIGLVAEAPSAYKDIGAVMRAQSDLVRIVRVVYPVLSYKGAD